MNNSRIAISHVRPAESRLSTDAANDSPHPTAASWDWKAGLAGAWNARRAVLLFAGLVTLVAAVISVLQATEYTARATLLPPRSQGKLSSLASLAPSILSMAGASLPSELGGGSDLYPTILKSESVIRPLLDRQFPLADGTSDEFTSLLEITDSDDPQTAVERVRELVQTRVDRPTGACEVSITLNDPATAAAVCNAFVRALSDRRIALHASGAAQMKDFVASRLEQVRAELSLAETVLEQFRSKNRNYNSGGSPQLQIEDDRLTRQVMLKSQLYIQLNQEYEMARIEETRDVADIQILDTASVPTIPSGPHRIRATLGAGFSSLPVAIAAILLWNYITLAWGIPLPAVMRRLTEWRARSNVPMTPVGEKVDRD